jgi:Subtilase family
MSALTAAAAWAAPSASAASTALAPLPASDYETQDLCATPAPRHAGCLAVALVPKTAAARARTHPLGIIRTTPARADEAAEGVFGLRPQDLHSAYDLPTGQIEAQTHPQTIGIVDAFNDANAEADLEVYDQEFGLPACTHANGCFTKVNQRGQSAVNLLPESSSTEARGWAGEIATDVEVTHAVCQDCHIVLVEADSSANDELAVAEDTAVELGATEVSNSWGSPEVSGEDLSAFDHPRTVITVSAGDDGYLDWDAEHSSERTKPDFPATSPDVVAVGGTHLLLDAHEGSWAEETVWNGDGATGGGCSNLFTAPSWQPSSAVGCGSRRAVADVAADGDPYTGVAVYDSTPDPSENDETGWSTIGGTSVASPIIASAYALAGGAHGVAYPAETLYANLLASPASLHDVTSGSNGECHIHYLSDGTSGCTIAAEATQCSGDFICKATTGFDGPSGVGSPDGLGAFTPTSGQPTTEPESEQANETPTGPSEEPLTHESTNPGASQTPVGAVSPISVQPSPVAPPTVQSTPSTLVPQLSGLALATSAFSALNRSHPKATAIAFSFILNLSARVRVTLARQVKVHGHKRWETVPGSFTITASAGRTRLHLKSRQTLGSGRYLLTCTPAQGSGRSLVLVLG